MTLTGLLFVLLFFIGLALTLARHPIYGLFTYIAVFYIHPPSRWWGAFLPDLRWSLLAAAVTMLAIWWRLPADKTRPPWYSTTPAKIMIAFVIWYWIMYIWALDRELHTIGGVLITKYLLVYYMVYRLIDTSDKTTAFLFAHLLGCFFLGFLALGAAGGDRLDGVGGPGIDDSNTLGMHLATGVMAGAMLALHWRGWRQYLVIVGIAFALNTLVMTGSRGAFLALVAGGAVLAWLRPPSYKRLFYAFAALGLLLFAYVASEQFWNRINTVTANEQKMDSSAQSRVEMIRAQFAMWSKYPMGTGHRGSEVLSARYLESKYLTQFGARSSHNVFMTVLVEQGIPGAIMSFILIAWVARSLRELKRQSRVKEDPARDIQAAAVGGALMVVMIGGLFADFSKCEVQIWMFALLAGLLHPSTASDLVPKSIGDAARSRGYDQRAAQRVR